MRPDYHRLVKLFPCNTKEALAVLRPFGPDWKLNVPKGDLAPLARRAVVALGLPWKGVACLPLGPLPEEERDGQSATFMLDLIRLSQEEDINFWQDAVHAFVLGTDPRELMIKRSWHFRRLSGNFNKITLVLRRRRLAYLRMLHFLAKGKAGSINGIVDSSECLVRMRLVSALAIRFLSLGRRTERVNRAMLDPLLALYAAGWAPSYIMPNGKLLVFVARQTQAG